VKKVLAAAGKILGSSSDLFRQCAVNDGNMPPAVAPTPAPAPGPANFAQRILVVDDERDARQLTVDVLKASGYDVEAVKDGAAGLAALQAGRYDLIVTDNKMPGMSGVEMIEKLRSARMALPVVMVTGYLPTHEFVRKPWLKPDVILEKPFSNGDLLAAVKKLLPTDGVEDGPQKTPLPKPLSKS